MTKDPLWNQIRKALEERRFDRNLFERCAQDLLRSVHPGLVPVVGGSDAGFDGALPSKAGFFPLICTTEDDVIGNFTKSIKNYLKDGGPRRSVVATSIFLTPRKRRNLSERAQALGVVIEQIHDGEDFVGRLYVHDKWRLDLLGITGSPPALSILPPRPRHVAAPVLVGRDEDLEWLQSTEGDLLLVGQPGSGKTFLHRHWASSGDVVFAVTDEPTQLANAIRAQAPKVIVIDDAHIRLHQIDHLRRLRMELDAPFNIHANCWPKHDQPVAARLELKPDQVRHLQPVARKKLATLIEAAGIVGPDALLQLLLDQARGKPGLLVALLEAVKRGGVHEVWTGEALAETLLAGTSVLRDGVDHEMLARFALGGDHGASARRVAKSISIPLAVLADRVADLGAGGVVMEGEGDAIFVMPEALRAVLVRDVFFKGLVRPDLPAALSDCLSAKDATHVLLGAAQRGAAIDRGLIRELVIREDADSLWKHYAFLDEDAARDILDSHPTKVAVSAEGLLANASRLAIPALIRADEAKLVKTEGDAHHPYRVLTDWVAPWEALDRSRERRALLLDALEALGHSAPPVPETLVLKYAAAAIQPGFRIHRSSPVNRYEILFRQGIHSKQTLESVMLLWPRVLDLLRIASPSAWGDVIDAVSNWAWPARYSQSISEELSAYMGEAARKMFDDVLAIPSCDRVRRHRIRSVAEHAGLSIEVPEDEFFDVIFDERDHDEPHELEQARRRASFERLADSLVARPADEAARLLGDMERDVSGVSMHAGWDRGQLYYLIAEKTSDLGGWIDRLIKQRIPAQFLWDFVERARSTLSDFRQLLARLLGLGEYRELANRFVLENSEAAGIDLIGRVISNLQPLGTNNEFRFRYDRIPVPVMLQLLQHPSPEVRMGAAIGEWQSSTSKSIRPELVETWRSVMVEAEPRHDRSFDEIFGAYPDIGFAWALARVEREDYGLWAYDGTIAAVAPTLDVEQRRRLLHAMNQPSSFDLDWFDAIVGDDWALFREWLDAQSNAYVRTLPLRRKPSARWQKLAQIAMDSGVRPEELEDQIGGWSDGWSGSESAHYQEFVDVYEELLKHSDSRFHSIAHRGLSWARRRVEDARKRESAEEI